MGERLMAKLDRLGAEAGIKQMTPEIYRFAMLLRADVVAQWPEREWVDLTPQDLNEIFAIARTGEHAVRLALDKSKKKNT